jgi:hypothetical protein
MQGPVLNEGAHQAQTVMVKSGFIGGCSSSCRICCVLRGLVLGFLGWLAAFHIGCSGIVQRSPERCLSSFLSFFGILTLVFSSFFFVLRLSGRVCLSLSLSLVRRDVLNKHYRAQAEPMPSVQPKCN